MISILIPCFKYLPEKLLESLHREMQGLDFKPEVLVWDDASGEPFSEDLKQLVAKFNFTFSALEENLGRAKIRNQMAEAAHFDYILFLDGDGLPESDRFIQNYVDQLADEVIVGGRTYSAYPPESTLLLHWKYGAKREVKSVSDRNKNPHFGFQSNNFLIPKTLFLKVKFDSKFEGYGHEDTVFGVQLRDKGIGIRHIDNPTQHLGLQRRSVFLEKCIEASEQLARFVNQGRLDFRDTRMAKMYALLKKFGLWKLFMLWASMRMPYIHRHLMMSNNPKLYKLDIYRLFFFGCNMP